MKKIVIAALIVLALGAAGCSAGTVTNDLVDGSVTGMPEGDTSNPFAVEPSDEVSDDVSDDVVVEDSDEVAVDEGDEAVETDSENVFKMQTEVDDVLTHAVLGTYYEQSFRMVDKDIDYLWSVVGLPTGTGLALTEEAASWRYKLHGTPAAADVGTHDVTIEVVDASDISKSTSISFELTVESNIDVIQISGNGGSDPCSKPLRIVVEQFGGNVDPQVLAEGKFRAKIESEANIRLRAVRGIASKGGSVTAPVGEVKWSFKSRVKNSYHRINNGGGSGTWQMPGIETYSYWDTDAPCTTPEEIQTVMEMMSESFWPDCSDFYHLTYDQKDLCEKIGCSKDDWPTGAYGSQEYEQAQQCINGFECPDDWNSPYLTDGQKEACREYHYWKKDKEQWLENKFSFECKWTKNPTWQGEAVTANGDVLELNGQMLFDGPLPVRNLPLDQDAVEELDISVSDGCYLDKRLKPAVSKRLEIGVQYPVGGEGGRIEDIEVKMGYEDVRDYWYSGYYYDDPAIADSMEPGAPMDFNIDCDDPEFKAICESQSKLVMLFTDDEGLSDYAWDQFDYWEVLPAIEDSIGHVFYDFTVCDDGDSEHPPCEEMMVDHLNVVGNSKSVLDVKRIYLMWVLPPRIKAGNEDPGYADFDIRYIHLRNKYWRADFDDENNDFDNNLTKHTVRWDLLTDRDRFPGMSPANSKGGVFRREELAGYVETTD